jgi:spermidine synthase
MRPKFSAWQRLRSYVFPVIIDRRQSRFHPYLEVSLTRGRLMLNTALANYSYGGLHRVFQIAFSKIGLVGAPLKNVLILGFGAGSVATILRDELKVDAPITGVEQDYAVIQIARDFFDIDRLHTLTLVADDAFAFVQHAMDQYDLVAVDLYHDVSVPDEFESDEFLQQLHRLVMPGGLVVFNKVAATKKLYAQFTALEKKFDDVFGNVEVIKALGINRVLVSRKR